MDAYEATKVVFSRVQSLDPENASKIMGLLLIQDHGEKEMIRLAFGPQNLLHSLVLKARLDLGVSNNTSSTNTSSTTINTNTNNNNNSTINNNNINFTKQNSTTCASRFLPHGVKIPTSLTIPTLVSPSNTNSSSPSWSGSMFSEGVSSPSCVMTGTGTGTGSKSTLNPSTPPFYRNGGGRSGVRGGAEMMDEFQLQEQQLSFLNDGCSSSPTTLLRPKSSDMFYSNQSELLGNGNGVGVDGEGDWDGGIAHRRSYSVSDVNLGSLMDDPANGFGWKPCLYYAKGFCKNGSSCRFVHGESELEGNAFVGSPSKLEMMEQCHELLRSKSMQHHKFMAAMASASPSTSPSFPYSINKGLNLFAHHHQNDSPRAAAAAAAALMMGEDMNKFSRSPRGLDSCRADLNPASRQIYLTFPADSTFREEDVSNYFSIYGPVQDVRIPYQQKRMFGFVTFVYPETVKIILAKGNPHFVCDSRVLVKPYKEKGKVPDKFRKHQQQMERGEFSSCGSPTGVDSRDLFDPPIGGRMMYETQSQYMLWRRKLEEQADLQQQALELQTRRLMGLQLLDVKRNHHHRSLSTGAPSIHSPSQSPNSIFHQSLLGSDRSSPDASDEICVSPPPLSEANQALEQAINEVIDREKEGSNGGEDNNINFNYNKPSPCHQDNIFDLPESLEHNLPDSPFASPKRLAGGGGSCEAEVMSISANMNSKGSSFLPPSPAIEMAPFKSCYFQMPRFSPGHGAIGM